MIKKISIILFFVGATLACLPAGRWLAHCLIGGTAFADALTAEGQPCPPECVTDSMEIVTWYPSPYNEYEELRLYPTQRFPDDCNDDKIGLMYYDHGGTPSSLDADDDKMMICKGTLLSWREVGGEGFWKFVDSSTSDIYYTKSGNVGIGTASPQAKLHIVETSGGGGGGILGVTTSFVYTDTYPSPIYEVPFGITAVTIDAYGASGGGGALGGRTKATIGVAPGEKLYVIVGGQGKSTGEGGYNGGGSGNFGQLISGGGSGGGGASSVYRETSWETIIVAAGGGGRGSDGSQGGAGGGASGSNGTPSTSGGGGGTQTAGGAAGAGSGAYYPAGGGGFGSGGSGSRCYDSEWAVTGGGGGGGGWYGGGGGGGCGGGGGGSGGGGGGSGGASSSARDVEMWSGVNSGNGSITITTSRSDQIAVYVEGVLTVDGSKNFEIPHPAIAGMKLVHSSLEGPEIGVYYRGEARLNDGQAVITLPNYFEALTMSEGRSVLLTPVSGWSPLYVDDGIKDGKFVVRSAAGVKNEQKFFWEVKAVRKDIPPLVVEKRGRGQTSKLQNGP